jgi:hypothetical protein
MVQHSVLPYLEAEDQRIRTEAALTCANLIVVPGKNMKIRGPTALIIDSIISRLLEVRC